MVIVVVTVMAMMAMMGVVVRLVPGVRMFGVRRCAHLKHKIFLQTRTSMGEAGLAEAAQFSTPGGRERAADGDVVP